MMCWTIQKFYQLWCNWNWCWCSTSIVVSNFCSISAHSIKAAHAIKVVREPEPRRAFTTVVFALCATAICITYRNVWNSSGFVKSWLFVNLAVVWWELLRCSRVWCFLPQPPTQNFIEPIQSLIKLNLRDIYYRLFLQQQSEFCPSLVSFWICNNPSVDVCP